MLGKPKLGRMGRIAVAAAGLPLLVLLIGVPIASAEVMPPYFEPTYANEATAATLFVSISGYLGTLALALIVGSGFLILSKERRGPDWVHWTLALGVAGAAMLSIFLGFRFQTDVASQLSLYHLDAPRIMTSFAFQAAFVLAAASILIAFAVDRLEMGPRFLANPIFPAPLGSSASAGVPGRRRRA